MARRSHRIGAGRAALMVGAAAPSSRLAQLLF